MTDPADPLSAEECAICRKFERLLDADQSEEWVADMWSTWTEHPHGPPDPSEPAP